MSHLDMICFVRECYPKYGGQLYVNLTDCAKIFGMPDRKMREHLIWKAVPWYRPAGGAKMYNVLEVLDSIQGTRWDQREIGKEEPA